jgi:hypothetical protein
MTELRAWGASFSSGWGISGASPFHLLGAGRISPRPFTSRSDDSLIRVYDESGNVIETHEHNGDFKEW